MDSVAAVLGVALIVLNADRCRDYAGPPLDTLPLGYRFGRHALLPVQRQLLCDGMPLKLGARAFDVPHALIEQRHRHLPKVELIERVWPDVVVEENNLEVHVWALRKLLGAQAIATIPGRGYRFALPIQGDPGAPVPAEPLRRGALPRRLPPLIGRDAELTSLRHAVDEHPLITVTGVGGIGKSLLAQHLMALEDGKRPHGVCWIDLAPVADAALVCATVAGALGLSIGGGDPHCALASAAAPLKLLMVLDNAEHVLAEVAAVVQALLDAAPALHVVVTSQVPLKLSQERVHRLGPLAAPQALPALPSPQEAMTFGAVALFVERVSALQPRFALTDANLAAVCSLCRHLDGSPLAIELAAARVPLLGVHGLERALDERLQLLTQGRRGAPARQHTLRAALEWSCALLSTDEQRAFRRLAVFAGNFTLEMAQHVAADPEFDRWRLLSALDALVDHSLVAVLETEPPRYRLLESALALARERLAESAERPALQERHARAVLARFAAVNHEFVEDRLRRDQMLDHLAPDLDNGRAAMAWALQHDAALAVALVTPLTNAFGRTRSAEGRTLWPATEALLRDDMPPELRLMWMLGAAMFHYTEFQNARACGFAHVAISLARQVIDTRRLALALGIVAAGDESAGIEARQAALGEMRALQASGAPLLSRINGAQAEFVFAYRHGDLDACETAGRRWLELTRVPGWEYDRSVALSNMADLALARGQVEQAVAMGRELEAELSGSRHPHSLAVARANLTTALLAAGHTAEARRMAELGWPMAESWRLQPYWGVTLALLAAQESRPRAAAALLGYAQARLAAAGMVLETNEARALAESRALALDALDETAFECLQSTGKGWTDEHAGSVALAQSELA